MTSLILIIVAVFLLIFLSRNLQRKMLYFPGRQLPPQIFLSTHNIRYWPVEGNYRGFVGDAQTGKPVGTIIVFHGNAGTASDRVHYIHPLTDLGYRVILAEYPGYGGRSGDPGEEIFVSDARETLRLAENEYGGPIYLLGESLGCGVVASIMKDPGIRIDGIILITPWDTLQSIAGEKFPWLPVRMFLKDQYDSVGNLGNYRGNIVIVGAERDEVIPWWHAEALAKALPNTARTFTIKGAGHNDWPEMVDLAWWKEITDSARQNASP